MKLSTLRKLADYFNCSLDYLVDDNVTEPSRGEIKTLNISELGLIKTYRQISTAGQEIINNMTNNIIEYGKPLKRKYKRLGYLMIDADKNLSLVPEGRKYHEATKKDEEIQEIFDVKDRVCLREDALVEAFIEEHGLRDYNIK